jgi:hypothetical protein
MDVKTDIGVCDDMLLFANGVGVRRGITDLTICFVKKFFRPGPVNLPDVSARQLDLFTVCKVGFHPGSPNDFAQRADNVILC